MTAVSQLVVKHQSASVKEGKVGKESPNALSWKDLEIICFQPPAVGRGATSGHREDPQRRQISLVSNHCPDQIPQDGDGKESLGSDVLKGGGQRCVLSRGVPQGVLSGHTD